MSTNGSEPDSAPRLTVEDPDDYNLTRRYRQIHNARDHVKDVLEEVGDAAARKEMPRGRYRERLAHAVAFYAMELEWVMRDEENDDGEPLGGDVWEEVEIEAPRHPNGSIHGIGGFVDEFGYIEVVETVEYDTPLVGGAERTETRETMDVPSVATIMRIYRQCNRFLREIGLDVKIMGAPPAPDANPVDPTGRFNE